MQPSANLTIIVALFQGTNCSAIGKFHCHKESGQVCISRDYMCDDYSDCLHDEDESYEFAKCKIYNEWCIVLARY